MNAPLRLTLLRKYRAMWAEAADLLMARGYSKVEAACARDEVTIATLGQLKSSADFDRADFDRVFQAIDAIIKPDDLNRQIQPPDARLRAQLIYSIGKEEKFPGYAAGISTDIYHRRDFENLATPDLLTLRRRIGNDAKGYRIPPRKVT